MRFAVWVNEVEVVNEFIVDPKVKELRDPTAADDGNVHSSGATRVRVPLHVALLSPPKCAHFVIGRGFVNLSKLFIEYDMPLPHEAEAADDAQGAH